MEQRFDHDFGRVRVHADAAAAASARSIGALAYTVGADIVLGRPYSPRSAHGRALIAHELAHVVQQRGASAAATRAIDSVGDQHERQADEAERRVVAGEQAAVRPLAAPAPLLQRKAECSIDHVTRECDNAATSCAAVSDFCKRFYPKPADIDAKVKKGREEANKLKGEAPFAADNMLHFLGASGKEKVMPATAFADIEPTKTKLLEHRDKFLAGVKRRLESGEIVPGVLSDELAWTDTAKAFDFLKKTDIGYAVGGYTVCSKVRVRVKALGGDRFEVAFEQWTVQVFDCYNWDPEKNVGIPGAADRDMCCIENAGKGKHFLVRTDPWENKDEPSRATGTVTARLPAAPDSGVRPTPPMGPAQQTPHVP